MGTRSRGPLIFTYAPSDPSAPSAPIAGPVAPTGASAGPPSSSAAEPGEAAAQGPAEEPASVDLWVPAVAAVLLAGAVVFTVRRLRARR
jgi:hypothetical protein